MDATAAHYIDPGTGSMLFTLFIGIVTTAYFFARQLIIRLKFAASGGAGAEAKDSQRLPYVIFSDSKRYWNVFKPICDEAERRGLALAYWTASPDDPALDESYEHVSCEFIGEGNKAFARLNLMSADICLATTPGLDVYQWKRSKEVSWYVHTLHAVGSAAGYRMFGIDYFDAMLLSGQFQVDEVRELERKRDLPPKDCEIVGCTYLDVMAERRAREGLRHESRTTVLLAPSWGPDAILSTYGGRILDALLKTGFDIIVRPHPQTVVSEAEMLADLRARYPESERLSWNFDNDNFEALSRADVMVSDFSGVVFDYALVFDRPVIYTEGRFDDEAYDASWLDEPLWKFSVYPTLGIPLREEQFDDLKDVIERAMTDEGLREGRERARSQVWAHRGQSARLTVDYLERAHAALMRGERPGETPIAAEAEGAEEGEATGRAQEVGSAPLGEDAAVARDTPDVRQEGAANEPPSPLAQDSEPAAAVTASIAAAPEQTPPNASVPEPPAAAAPTHLEQDVGGQGNPTGWTGVYEPAHAAPELRGRHALRGAHLVGRARGMVGKAAATRPGERAEAEGFVPVVFPDNGSPAPQAASAQRAAQGYVTEGGYVVLGPNNDEDRPPRDASAGSGRHAEAGS